MDSNSHDTHYLSTAYSVGAPLESTNLGNNIISIHNYATMVTQNNIARHIFLERELMNLIKFQNFAMQVAI